MKKILVLLCFPFILMSCARIEDIYGTKTGGKPTDTEINSALKQALVQGISNGSYSASKRDGYYGNNLIRIPWPDDAMKIKNTLSTLGFSGEIEKVEMSINRAAEKAASESLGIFKTAISQLTLNDVVDIISGNPDAATNYLKRTTSTTLEGKFEPIINRALTDVNATKYWTDAITIYNDLPTTFYKVNPDLTDFVTEKAIEGLFVLVAQEEAKIRKDPVARATGIMKKVFGYYDKPY